MRSTLLSPQPVLTDNLWFVWGRILCNLQQNDASLPENDLNWNDSVQQIREKVLKAERNLNGE